MTPRASRLSIATSRVYDRPGPELGLRVLVDRLWPRGMRADAAPVDRWLKELAPSNELRRWYGHDPARWDEFRRRYFAELDAQPEAVAELLSLAASETLVLVYSSREQRYNNATALKEYIEAKLSR